MPRTLVPIVFATDDAFAPYCGTSIASLLFYRDREREYAIHIFHDGLSEENIRLLGSMATEKVTISFVDIGAHINHNLLYTQSRLTVATYYRFFAADVLPQYDKLLYLDSDIAILEDVGRLYDIDIGDHLLGGVVIFRGHPTEVKKKERYLRELMDLSPDRYINAGVMLMNLKELREHHIKEKCLDYIATHRELRWLDQDALNAVCKGKICFLPECWNMSQFFYERDCRTGKDMGDICLIHYITNIKPWLVAYRPSHLFFRQAALLSPYSRVLQQEFLKVDALRTQPKEMVLQLARKGKLGPRYFVKCLINWVASKMENLFGKSSDDACMDKTANIVTNK